MIKLFQITDFLRAVLSFSIVGLWPPLVFGGVNPLPLEKKMIVIVNSYSHDYLATTRQQKGFGKTFFEMFNK